MLEQIGGNSPEGSIIGGTSTAKLGFYGAVPQGLRSSSLMGPSQLSGTGQVVTFGVTLSPVSVAANTVAEQSLTVTGVLATDFIFAFQKPTAQAGLGVVNVRVSAADTLAVAFINDTAAAVTPTATQVYNVLAIRGISPVTATLSPASIAANSAVEQVFSIAPTSAAGTVLVNAAGQVSGVNVTTAGTYSSPPTVTFVDSDSPAANPVVTGSLTGTPATAMGGYGATGVAVLNSVGGVIGVQMTKLGSGYIAATTTVVFSGGLDLQPGMIVQVSKPTTQAGLGIGGCRIADVNKVGITFVNPTGAAITPTAAEAYSIMALNPMAAITNIVNYGISSVSVVSVASITTAGQSQTVNGLLASDLPVGAVKPTQLTIGLLNGRCAANAYVVEFINPTQAAVTPVTTEVYGVSILRQKAAAPLELYFPVLTPVAVAANTTAEQAFTIAGLTYTNNSPATVFVNKPTWQPGLSIVGARISAANTLQITFCNNTAASITPTVGEQYTLAEFQTVNPGTGHSVLETVTTTAQSNNDLLNELVVTLSNLGLVKGV